MLQIGKTYKDNNGREIVIAGRIKNYSEFMPFVWGLQGDWYDEQAIEAQADVIWKWANETRDDGQTDAESGLDFPDIATDYRHLHSFKEKD
jgi:hypothetical protein